MHVIVHVHKYTYKKDGSATYMLIEFQLHCTSSRRNAVRFAYLFF